jgi:hypothetical protein
VSSGIGKNTNRTTCRAPHTVASKRKCRDICAKRCRLTRAMPDALTVTAPPFILPIFRPSIPEEKSRWGDSSGSAFPGTPRARRPTATPAAPHQRRRRFLPTPLRERSPGSAISPIAAILSPRQTMRAPSLRVRAPTLALTPLIPRPDVRMRRSFSAGRPTSGSWIGNVMVRTRYTVGLGFSQSLYG